MNFISKKLILNPKILNLSFIKHFSVQSTLYINNSNAEHYDVVIAGGGMVGTTLACSLGNITAFENKKILLLEGGTFKKFDFNNEYANRVSAVNKCAKELLDNIGAWDNIKKRYKPVQEMHVWDALTGARITFDQETMNSNLCYIVENDLIIDSVVKKLENHKNVTVKTNARIKDCNLSSSENDNQNLISLLDGNTYTCDLLVGADGINSIVRKSMKNNSTYSTSYNQMGVVATVELENTGSDNSIAWQRFIPTGPVALLPLNENLSSLVWSTTIENAKELISMPDDQFIEALNSAYTKIYKSDPVNEMIFSGLNKITGAHSNKNTLPPKVIGVKEKSRAGFPLGFSLISNYVQDSVVLIGDAAHRVHPLAGQGVNLGFGDIVNLTNVLGTAICQGARLGDIQHLLIYEQECLKANVPIMFGVHGIQKLYDTAFPPIVTARSIGLKIVDSIPILKKVFMQKAMA